ncbi:MAG: TATA-box-binding protein [Thermoplasmata archaeon]|jgi:transcription initiation factor TFIID TATA-box-binding protein|nr:MAG: TATA-box-binding protein [Thermoplasmata archaeon]RLF64666.1 MAG: TATA-box-binding protein [Thermoplasmata archaeon]
MADIKIQNMVASTVIAKELDLDKIASSLKNTKYNPDQFPGLVYHIEKPKVAFLLFKSGRVICTGAKNIDAINAAMEKLYPEMKKLGFDVVKPEVNIQNIVASVDLHAKLNLLELSFAFGLENIEYEPEIFPGMVYRLDEPNVVFLFFGSGKIVCTGAKKEEDIERAVEVITEELGKRGFL